MKHYQLKTLTLYIFSMINFGSTPIAKANMGDSSIINISKGDTLIWSAEKYRFSPTITWGDEFDYSGSPDNTKWGIEEGNGYSGFGNGSLQYNRPENATVSGSTLKIIAKNESFSGFTYTSSQLITRDTKMFQYGRFEVRAKLPVTGGMWPAIYLFGQNHKYYDYSQWPECGELDVFELNGNQADKIHTNIHTGFYNANNGNPQWHDTNIGGIADEFNLYRVDWTPEYIRWFINDVQAYEFVNDGGNHSHWPFDDYFSLIVNLSVGGAFTGSIDAGALPQTFEIDYVRYYELLGDYNTAPPLPPDDESRPVAPILDVTDLVKEISDYAQVNVTNVQPDCTVQWYVSQLIWEGDFLPVPADSSPAGYTIAYVLNKNNITGITSIPTKFSIRVVPNK
jgi:beta-glucanase (GH16 family)